MQDWLKPMLAEKADEVPTAAGWVLEPKLDGWRLIVFKAGGARSDVRVYGGRNGGEYTGQLPYLEEELFNRLPVGSAIDGELVSSNGFDNVGSVMRSGGGHRVTPHSPALTLVAFDMLMVNGTDIRDRPWSDRRTLLDTAHFEDLDHVTRTPFVPASDDAHRVFLSMGLEGSVAKRMDSRYVNRKTRLWVKIKPQQSNEARIIGFEPGKGDLVGLVGAFIVEMLRTEDDGSLVPTGVQTTLKCGTGERHREATEHPERWLNAVIEVNHHGANKKTGVPRHPQFGRRRDDR